MDVEQLVIDDTLVRRLVTTQFPQWADLSVPPVARGGRDDRTFHLGEHMIVRLPSAADYAVQVEKEHRWLPRLAPLLPLPIPTPLAIGEPANGYPWKWSIYRWLEGDTAAPERIADLRNFATSLAQFLIALQRIDPTGGPPPGMHNFHRGGALTTYNAEIRQAIAALEGTINVDAATEVWEAALATTWDGSPVWIHGDVGAGNLLVQGGRLSAVRWRKPGSLPRNASARRRYLGPRSRLDLMESLDRRGRSYGRKPPRRRSRATSAHHR